MRKNVCPYCSSLVIMMMQFRNKRIMEGSLFDVHRAEPSQQPIVAAPPLDMKRAESSQQHVRALNTQFARFIFYSMSTVFLLLDFHLSIFLSMRFDLLFWTFGLAYLLVVINRYTAPCLDIIKSRFMDFAFLLL